MIKNSWKYNIYSNILSWYDFMTLYYVNKCKKKNNNK